MNLFTSGPSILSSFLGINQSDAAKQAANIQSNSADKASQMQMDQFNTTNENFKPYREAGYTALSDLTKGTADGGYFSHQFDANGCAAVAL